MLGSATVRVAPFWWTKKLDHPRTSTPNPPNPSNETGNGVTLTWALQPDAFLFELERTDDVPVTDASVWTTIVSSSETTVDDSGLTTQTPYAYRLRAFGFGGWSDYSTVVIVTLDTVSPPATPAAPTITGTTPNSISTAWVAVPTATSYSLRRSTDQATWTTIVDHVNVLSKIDAITGGPFYYQVRAHNADGDSAYSASSPPTSTDSLTAPPTPTTAPTVVGTPGSSSVNLSMAAVARATELELQQAPGTSGGSYTTIATIPATGAAQTYLATGLAATSSYRFRYRGLNSASTGAEAFSPVRTVLTGSVSGTNVQPVSILRMRKNSGVAGHPNFGTGVFQPANAVEIVNRIADAGFGFMRGQFANEGSYLPRMRARGLKWICGVAGEGTTHPTDQTVQTTRNKVRDIRENAADVVVGIEGINEPNHNRGTGTIVSTWASETVDHQRAIWQESQWNLTSVGGPIGSSATAGSVPNPLRGCKIYGPSLHDVACENSYDGTANLNNGGPRHWHQLLDLGILNLQDAAGFHCYPGAGIPLRGARNRNLLESNNGGDPTQPLSNAEGGNTTGRLELMWSAFGLNYPSYTTEWGYHNALNDTVGHLPIDERGSGIYSVRGFIQMFTQPYRIGGRGLQNNTACTWFELLDDKNDALDQQEAHFGILGYNQGTDATNPNNWREKPQYQKMKAFFTRFGLEPLTDPDYTPASVFLGVATAVTQNYLEWQVFADAAQSAAGTATIAIYRTSKVWNRIAQTPVTVPTIAVDITDRLGTRPLQVGADVVYMDLR